MSGAVQSGQNECNAVEVGGIVCQCVKCEDVGVRAARGIY